MSVTHMCRIFYYGGAKQIVKDDHSIKSLGYNRELIMDL